MAKERKETIEMQLECVIEKDLLAEYSKKLAESIKTLTRLEASKKSYMEQIKANMSKSEAEVALMSDKVSSGKEHRPIMCAIHYFWDKKEKEFVRQDTGESVKTEIIESWELQEHIRFEEKEKKV